MSRPAIAEGHGMSYVVPILEGCLKGNRPFWGFFRDSRYFETVLEAFVSAPLGDSSCLAMHLCDGSLFCPGCKGPLNGLLRVKCLPKIVRSFWRSQNPSQMCGSQIPEASVEFTGVACGAVQTRGPFSTVSTENMRSLPVQLDLKQPH